MQPPFTEDHLVYKIRDSELYAAIYFPDLRDIREFVIEYKTLSAVPDQHLVKGILFRVINEHLYELKQQGREVVIPVNRLDFDTGNLRLTA